MTKPSSEASSARRAQTLQLQLIHDDASDTSGLRTLAARVDAFEREPLIAAPHRVDPDIYRFVAVMERVTPPGSWADAHDGQGPIDSAETADGVVARSEVLKRLERLAPAVVVGPLDRSSQLYPDGQTRVAGPTPSLLVEPSEEHAGKARAKPFGLGLFSSTGAFDGWSMWRVYLELNRGSTLFPEPWHVWKLEVEGDPAVLEISSACDWVDFVSTHPRRVRDLLYPDWQSAARRWDAIHLTARAIAATEAALAELVRSGQPVTFRALANARRRVVDFLYRSLLCAPDRRSPGCAAADADEPTTNSAGGESPVMAPRKAGRPASATPPPKRRPRPWPDSRRKDDWSASARARTALNGGASDHQGPVTPS